jgi:hypothetical protein
MWCQASRQSQETYDNLNLSQNYFVGPGAKRRCPTPFHGLERKASQ